MIKGCNRRVIVMRETGNDMIEEAFFVLRSCATKSGFCEEDIIKHANGILEKSNFDSRFSSLSMNVSEKKRHHKNPLPFLLGMAIGAILSATVFLII